MIRLESVSKLFPGQARPAVDGIDLEVPEGQTCALIGPSGCGKTTTLRIINRLIEPSAGRILVGGEDVTEADPVQLRRRIGYVIQGVGLFPHMSVADNVATVPRLLGWPRAKVRARVAEMLDRSALTRPSSPAAARRACPAVSASGSASPARSRPTRP
jgi:osmoprotectant transport system ATP-binding protein